MIDDNIYILLDIEPNTKDIAFLTQALDKKIAEWNAKMNVNMQLAQQKVTTLLALKNTIQRDNFFLVKQGEEAKKYFDQKKKEEMNSLIELSKLMVVNGQIDDRNLDTLKSKFKNYTETKILEIIKAKIKAKKVFKYKDDGIELTSIFKSLMSQVNKNLEIIKKNTLYEFLEASPTSSGKVLLQKSHAIAAEIRMFSERTPERTSMEVLCSQANQIFGDNLNHKSYNKYLKYRVFENIERALIDIAKNTKIVTANQYKTLIDMCIDRHIDVDHAEYYLYDICNKRQYTILEDSLDTETYLSCRFCASLNQRSNKQCISCGLPLIVECPSCKRISNSNKEFKCANCSFDIGSMPNALISLKRAENFLFQSDLINTEKEIFETKRYWPTIPMLKALEDQLKEVKDEQKKFLSKLQELSKEKKYIELNRLVKTSSSFDSLKLLENEAENAIKKAHLTLSRIRLLSDSLAKIEVCLEALSICSDLSEAKRELRLNPPPHPSNLNVSVLSKSMRLTWSQIKLSNITYIVVRKINARPLNPSDGEVIATIKDCFFDDIKPIQGVSYYYAVYTKCADIYSQQAVVEGPFITLGEIDGSMLEYVIQKDQINFSCKFPENAKCIEVFRDNVLIKTVLKNNFVDSSLITEKEYLYKFKAVYEDCLGRKYRSSGIEIRLTPIAPPKIVDVKVSSTSESIIINWTNPQKGVFEIYYSDKPFSQKKNDFIDIDLIGKKKLYISGETCIINKNFNGFRYYLPLTVLGKMGVAGEQIGIMSILKPSGVSFNRVDDRNIDVLWQWDDKVDAVRIKSKFNYNEAASTDIYHLQNPLPKFTLSIPKNAKFIELEVMNVLKLPKGELFLSEPIEHVFYIDLPKIEFIDVKKDGFFSRNKYQLTLKTEAKINSDLQLLIAEGLPPCDLNNYHSYLTILSKDLEPNKYIKYTVVYERKDKTKGVIFRLIPADKSQLGNIVISPEVRQIK